MLYLENENDCIVIENEYIRREITFRSGRPVHSVLIRPESGYRWEENRDDAVLSLPGFDWDICETTYDEEKGIVTFDANYIVRWVLSAAENAPAIRSQLFAKAHPNHTEEDFSLTEGVPGMNGHEKAHEITERVAHTGKSLKLRSVRFYDCTDSCDSLVRQTDAYLYHSEEEFYGSLFFASDVSAGESCVLCKEAPVGSSHLNRSGADCYADYHHLEISGSGIDYHALSDVHFTAGYPVTSALCRAGAEEETARALYTDACGGFLPFIMSDVRGTRSADCTVCEKLLTEEIRTAKQLGVDIVQIGEGWQKGCFSDPAAAKNGIRDGFYDSIPDFWTPDPQKFPHGFAPLCDCAYSHGVSLGLWFVPDGKDCYANWKRDAETLLGFFRTYGIRHFCLDGISITDKESEYRFIRMCFLLLSESEGRITFSLNITKDARPGYFFEKELGTLLAENRYTNDASYYPHNTLRNLWQLSHYLPAQKLLFEVPDLRRDPQNYLLPDGTPEPLAPARYDADYIFASVMVSNPLLFSETQRLSEEDKKRLSSLISVYRQYRDDFREIIPRGNCPDGYSVTGFEIRGEKRCYYIGIREFSEKNTLRLPVERILASNDEELLCDGDSVIFSDHRKYFFAILRTQLNTDSSASEGTVSI